MTQQQKSVDAWNAIHETVVPVTYRDDDGYLIATKTRSKAFLLSGRDAAIFIYEAGAPVMLDRVTVRR